jgi:hypothetical protein
MRLSWPAPTAIHIEIVRALFRNAVQKHFFFRTPEALEIPRQPITKRWATGGNNVRPASNPWPDACGAGRSLGLPADELLRSRARTRTVRIARPPPQAQHSTNGDGVHSSRLVYTAASLGIADHLANSPKSARTWPLHGVRCRVAARFMRTLTNFSI